MKKIVILKSHLQNLGGAEKYTVRLAEAFLIKGCDVTFLTAGQINKKLNLSPKIHCVHFPKTSKFGFLQLKSYDKYCNTWLSNNSPDIVFGMDRNSFHTHYRASNGVHAAYLAHRSKQENFLKRLSFKINPLHRTILNFEKSLFESPHLKTLFTNSRLVKEEVLNYYNVDSKKIHVVHNGVEWHEMESYFSEWQTTKSTCLRNLGLNASAYQFLFIGNDYKRKGLEQLLHALTLFKNADFQLSVIGKEKNINSFKRLAAKFNLEKKVFFFGMRSDIYNFYQMADCLVIPSIYDPFANVTIEGLAMGLFIVTSSSNGGSEILTSDNGSIIEDLYDPYSIKIALEKALHNPKTKVNAVKIRESVKHLDFSHQLAKIVDATLI